MQTARCVNELTEPGRPCCVKEMQLDAFMEHAMLDNHAECVQGYGFSMTEGAHDGADEDTNTIVDAADFSFTGDTPGLHCFVCFC